MFEAVSNTTRVPKAETVTGNVPLQSPVKSEMEKKAPEGEQTKQAEDKAQEAIDQTFLSDLEKDIELIHNVDLQFSVHKSTGRTMVRVINKDTGNTIREIPPKEILDLAAKIDEMIGILFDRKV